MINVLKQFFSGKRAVYLIMQLAPSLNFIMEIIANMYHAYIELTI